MKRVNEDWYQGTADAVFQNFHSIEVENPEHTLVLAADHIYKMDYGEMLDWHHRHHADITIATILVAPEEASRFLAVARAAAQTCATISRSRWKRLIPARKPRSASMSR